MKIYTKSKAKFVTEFEYSIQRILFNENNQVYIVLDENIIKSNTYLKSHDAGAFVWC